MDNQKIHDVLSGLLTELGFSFSDINITEDESMTRVEVVTDIPSKLIGWHGETLNSVQHVLKAILRTQLKLDKAPFIVLDVDGYRKTQEDKVCKIADQKADLVRRTGNRIALPPMSPYFRRVVHLYIAGEDSMQDLTTQSTGEGEFRQIVLQLKEGSSAELVEELSPVISEDDSLDNLDI